MLDLCIDLQKRLSAHRPLLKSALALISGLASTLSRLHGGRYERVDVDSPEVDTAAVHVASYRIKGLLSSSVIICISPDCLS